MATRIPTDVIFEIKVRRSVAIFLQNKFNAKFYKKNIWIMNSEVSGLMKRIYMIIREKKTHNLLRKFDSEVSGLLKFGLTGLHCICNSHGSIARCNQPIIVRFWI
ncbi:MAG: hypothetical protein MHMPM18_001586 [Marteilia pararefringens]